MQPMNRAAPGLLCLCALLFLTACNNGHLVTRTEFVEVPHRQYVPLPTALTTVPQKPTAPSAECTENGRPVRCTGQLLQNRDDLEDWGDGLVDQIKRIKALVDEAITVSQ